MSKKIILVSVFTAGLLFSCQKQQFTPRDHHQDCSEVTTYRGVSSDNIDLGDIKNSTDAISILTKDDISITDPNNDEDRGKKKKGNN